MRESPLFNHRNLLYIYNFYDSLVQHDHFRVTTVLRRVSDQQGCADSGSNVIMLDDRRE